MTTNNPFFKKREAIARNLPTRPHTPETGTTNSPTHRTETNNSFNTAPDAAIKRKEVFNALVNDYDDEEEALLRAKQQNSLNRIASQSEIDSPILGKIEAKVKELQKKYPTGGIKTSRYITADILIEAPANFFDMYEKTIEEGANYVRQELGDSNQSSKIAEAEQNPTDDFYQDEAYYIVQGIVSDYMSRSMWRDTHRKIISAMILNEILGFGRLEPLWRDRKIDEIICNGPHDIQVEISGELVKVPGCQFRDPAHLMRLIDKLYGSIGKTVTPLTPLVKGRLHDKSRMFAVHQTVAPDGPNISIRRHPEGFWTPEELVKFGSAPPELMTDLGNLIYKGASFMVAGGTHSGKALVYNTKIHTPSGTTTMGEIKVGDKVFDHNGNIATVLNKFPQPARQVYAVKFSNGEISYVDAEHNWFVSTHESRKSNLYRESYKTNSGWKRKTIYTDTILQAIKERMKYVNEDGFISYSEGIKQVGMKNISTVLREKLSSLEKTHNKVSEKEFYETLFEYGSTYSNDQRHKKIPLYSVMTTTQMMNTGMLHKTSVQGHKRYNFHIPVLKKAVEYENSLNSDELPIHPYLLGLWLGDGSSSKSAFTGTTEDVQEYGKLLNEMIGENPFKPIGKSGKEWAIASNNFKKKLKELNILQETTVEGSRKRIPDLYKYASIEARRMLVFGLIDSDGWVDSRTAGWVFTNTNETLVKDYVQVASSLGYKARRSNDKQKRYEYQGKKKVGKISWDVTITTHDILAKLPRKIKTHQKMIQKYPVQSRGRHDEIAIIDIYPVEGRIEEMACITVDSPDSTYMIEDSFITTHNTSLLNALTGFYKPKVRILTLEDNLEMKPNPKKYLAPPMECKTATSDSDNGVSMRDLVKASLQLRPDVIIVGEVTDDAAFDLAQALNTGHAGASTTHANTAAATIPRVSSLIAQGGLATIEGSLDMIAAAFDFIVVTQHFPVDGSRRIVAIEEVGTTPVNIEGRLTLETKPLWKFFEQGLDENGKIVGEWRKLGDLSKTRMDQKNLNINKDLTWEELKELSSIPEGYAIHSKQED